MRHTKRIISTGLLISALTVGLVGIAEPASAATPCVSRTFGQGWASNTRLCVQSIQLLLGPNWGTLEPDGVFGERTRTVVGNWQTAYRLPVDGIVGPKTWASLCKVNGPTGAAVYAGCRF